MPRRSGGSPEPWLLETDEDHAEAKRLLEGWHARHKKEAKALGIERFDSVFDLARILRPVGSLNGKGEQPIDVELLDDGGPSYTIAQLTAEAVMPDRAPPR